MNLEFKLTESELQLGKVRFFSFNNFVLAVQFQVKPHWIPDYDCLTCMLCSCKFNLVNRRHHCRSCGRVLCGGCCATRRLLPYMSETESKQRVCFPCNKTLDRIEDYNKYLADIDTKNKLERNR